MKIIRAAMQRLGLDFAWMRDRKPAASAEQAVDSLSPTQALGGVVGEVSEPLVRVPVLRASSPGFNYAAEILDAEPTEAEFEAAMRARFELQVLELQELDIDTLNHLVDVALEKIFTQMSAWGEDVFAVMGDCLECECDVPDFTSREFWRRVEDVLVDFGLEWPFGSVGAMPFELATLSSALVYKTGRSELMPYAGRLVWTGYVYEYFNKNRDEIVAGLAKGKASL